MIGAAHRVGCVAARLEADCDQGLSVRPSGWRRAPASTGVPQRICASLPVD